MEGQSRQIIPFKMSPKMADRIGEGKCVACFCKGSIGL